MLLSTWPGPGTPHKWSGSTANWSRVPSICPAEGPTSLKGRRPILVPVWSLSRYLALPQALNGHQYWFPRGRTGMTESYLTSRAPQVVPVEEKLPANSGSGREGDLIPGSGRPPGGERGNPLQYSCLENRHGQRSQASMR